jgi:hypothetical protein
VQIRCDVRTSNEAEISATLGALACEIADHFPGLIVLRRVAKKREIGKRLRRTGMHLVVEFDAPWIAFV